MNDEGEIEGIKLQSIHIGEQELADAKKRIDGFVPSVRESKQISKSQIIDILTVTPADQRESTIKRLVAKWYIIEWLNKMNDKDYVLNIVRLILSRIILIYLISLWLQLVYFKWVIYVVYGSKK